MEAGFDACHYGAKVTSFCLDAFLIVAGFVSASLCIRFAVLATRALFQRPKMSAGGTSSCGNDDDGSLRDLNAASRSRENVSVNRSRDNDVANASDFVDATSRSRHVNAGVNSDRLRDLSSAPEVRFVRSSSSSSTMGIDRLTASPGGAFRRAHGSSTSMSSSTSGRPQGGSLDRLGNDEEENGFL